MRGQPFTELCRQLADLARSRAADLHAHTTASDGDYTPSQVVALAKQKRLDAVAVTDHDTLAGAPAAVEAGRTFGVQVVPGVEVSTAFEGRELHLLAYFAPLNSEQLNRWFDDVCRRRRERFDQFIAALAERGVALDPWRIEQVRMKSTSLGRRHLASLIVASGVCKSRFDAFRLHLHSLSVPKSHLTPIDEAINNLRAAGAVTSLAHPPEDLDEATAVRLRSFGLNALEVNFPAASAARSLALRALAAQHGLTVTGGSDCHGPEPGSRVIGSHGISRDELNALQRLAGGS